MPAITLATDANPRVDDFLPMGRLNDSTSYHVQAGGIAGLAGRGQLSSDYAAGSTQINVSGIPKNMGSYQGWLVIDPYTNECEIRRIAAITGNQVTIGALSYNHNVDDPVIFTDAQTVHVGWFGAKGDNSTNDVTAINLTIAIAYIISGGYAQNRPGRINVLFSSGSAYAVNTPILMWDKQGITLDGGAPGMGGAMIHGRCSGQAILEIIGCTDVVVKNFQFWGDQVSTPACATWTGRSNTVHGSNSGNITFSNIAYMGYYTKACHYCISSESNHFYESWSYPYGNTGMEAIIYINNQNDLGITPAGGTLNTNNYGNNDMQIQNCGLTSGPGYTCLKIKNYCNVTFLDTYLYSLASATISMIDGASLTCNGIGCEGTPDNIIELINVGGGTPFFSIRIYNSHLGTPNNYTVLGNANTVLKDSTFARTERGVVGGANKPIKLYRAEGCLFDFQSSNSYVFDINFDGGYSVYNKFILGRNDTLTYTNGAYSAADIIESYSGTANFIQANGFRPYGGTTSKTINDIRTATATWDVGNLADGASAMTFVSINDVTGDSKWVAWASLTSLDEQGWMLTAYAVAGGVYVTLMNKSGAPIDPPSGTLFVAAMKVT